MKIAKIIAVPALVICVGGCATTGQYVADRRPAPLSPTLPPSVSVAVVAKDVRPKLETEKEPSGEYLYSGALFAVEGNEKTVATDISNIIMQYRGAQRAHPAAEIPKTGPAVLFQIDHWYSRTLRNPEKGPMFVTGQFTGVLVLYLDGEVAATENVAADGITTVIDTFIVFEREKKETPKLIWDGMLSTANSSQQNGYTALHAALLKNWGLLSREPKAEQPLSQVQK